MAKIQVNDLTFSYESTFDPIFEHVSFTIDTSWKLGFIGRNGKGKTTFLNLLLGKYDYSGSINCDVPCDYFPYKISDGGPIRTLSFGEKTKVMLAVLFAGENDFLLIDEPTNHLDKEAREIVKSYLAKKKGFILVSHDRDLLDACVDHVLVLNRSTIEVQNGNFSSWWENKERADAFARAENEKHMKEIGRLKSSMQQSQRWATKSENTKIGYDPIKEHDRSKNTRGYIGAKTKKMESRVKVFEQRMERSIEEKEGLLNDETRDLSLQYKDSENPVFEGLTFEIRNGERVFLQGKNGCGKTSLIKAILRDAGYRNDSAETDDSRASEDLSFTTEGTLLTAPHLQISYINQDTSHLHGDLRMHAFENGVDYSLFLAVLRQLALEQAQFEKNIEDFSEGQKKKVLIATSLLQPAHLYIWDEPLNYVDVFSRMQLEKLISEYQPTMLIVEHDVRFREKMATKVVEL